ncbi:MAG: M1 family metallopeptidase [Flavobacteriales bacterium]|nr:M1 family metallopeptidase [Flavobacteriales bacterium]
MRISLILILFSSSFLGFAQVERWQQEVDYVMNIDMDESKHSYTGEMTLVYTNNSPDDLEYVFFHQYFNAFRPGSMMDVRSRTISDPDPRVGDRIFNLEEDEQGMMKVSSLKMDGRNCELDDQGTILRVQLPKAIKAGNSAKFTMKWDARVPVQVRRSGWMNAEGVEFSMTQWYPKICEYDFEGWHANPYVGREFHGVWGNFEVNITIAGSYMIGSTGTLQNPSEVGYSDREMTQRPTKKGDVTWKFKAENVHDFAWAADPDFVSSFARTSNGTKLYFIHQDDEEINANWKELERFMVDAFDFLNGKFGEYPYSHYTFIQGGDGGMEYPMITLITGNRNLRSLVGVSVHEAVHSWYQGVLATNESKYEWMDEGFTSYATSLTMNKLFGSNGFPEHHYAYQGYFNIVRAEKEEPLITHADHYVTNSAYGTAAYSKGQVLLAQLGYVIGEENLAEGLQTYYDNWKYKHPNSNDFMRIMEKQSQIELDWYFDYFINTTHTIDYGVSEVFGRDSKLFVSLSKDGIMPMPVDLVVTLRSGEEVNYHIPLKMMTKPRPDDLGKSWTVLEAWPWTNPDYSLELPFPISDISKIEIDPSKRLADIDRSDNTFDISERLEFMWKR